MFFWPVCSHARRVSFDTTKMKQRCTEFYLWPSECRALPQTILLNPMLSSSGSQIFFIFPQTFLNRSPALNIDRFNVGIARVRRAISTATPRAKPCFQLFTFPRKPSVCSLALPIQTKVFGPYFEQTVSSTADTHRCSLLTLITVLCQWSYMIYKLTTSCTV